MSNLKGVFPALITPFTDDGKINETSLQKIIKMNIEKGVDGFYVCGTTGEVFLMSPEERKYVLEIVVQEVKGKCAIIAHIGCISTEKAIELAKHAEKLGVDAISSLPPFYYKFSFEEIKSYYTDIVNEVNLPMIVYNFPAFSGVSLTTEEIEELSKDQRFVGIKHTSLDLSQLERIKHVSEKLLVFSGYDEVFLGGLSMGSDGAIGSTFNFMAEKFIMIKKLFDAGRINEAQEIQKQANEIISVLRKVGFFQGIKYILEVMGIDCGECRKPFKRLSDRDKDILNAVIKKVLM